MSKLLSVLIFLGLLACRTSYQNIVSDPTRQYFQFEQLKGSNANLKLFWQGSYILSAFRSKSYKVKRASQKEEELFYSVDLKRNVIKDKDLKYEILGVLNFLDRQRVVFVSQFNQEVGNRYLDITNNEARKNKDIRKSFGFYNINANDSTKINIQLTKWRDTRSLFLYYTLHQDSLSLDSAFLKVPRLVAGKYDFAKTDAAYYPSNTKNKMMELSFKKRETIDHNAWRFDFTYDMHDNPEHIDHYEIRSILPVANGLQVNMKNDTQVVKEVFWHTKQR